MLAVTEAKQLF